MSQPPKAIVKPSRERLPLWLALALHEIRAGRSFAFSFVLNLSLGLIGFLSLDAFKASLTEHLNNRSRAILAADLAVSSRRPLSDEERAKVRALLPPNTVERESLVMYSMAAGGYGSRLVELRTIDEGFPFYGTITLQSGREVSYGSDKEILHQPKVWVYPELLIQLDLKVGDTLKLGETAFTIADVITKDPALSTIGFAAAPKVYLGQPFLEGTGLVRFGSRIWRAWSFKLPAGFNEQALAETLGKTLASTDIRVRTHKSASRQLGRMLQHLSDYLGLVALVALFLAAVGGAYLFRSFLSRRTGDIAVLLSLGGGHGLATKVYITQLLILGTTAGLLTSALGLLLVPVIPHVLGQLISSDVAVALPLRSVLIALCLGTAGSVLFCLPLLIRLRALNPASLFREEAAPRLTLSRRQVLGWLPALLTYWLMAMWQSQSIQTGSLFVGLFLGAGTILGLIAWVILQRLRRPPERLFALELALLNLSRHKAATLACFLAVSLGALLVNLVPQVQRVIINEIGQPEGVKTPSLFLFDIQDEQVEPLQERLAELAARLDYLSPLIQARLVKIKGETVRGDLRRQAENGTREQENNAWARNRTYNLSYRRGFVPSETLVAGTMIDSQYDWDKGGPALMSIEQRFASRLDVDVGDTMTFDVQGVTVEAQVANIRKVKWTSFHPNFFISLQPGVLDDAPKTWLAAIPQVSPAEMVRIQNGLVKDFPNVSIIDVTQTVRRILDIVTQMSTAITFMAWLSLLAGIAVVYSIASHQARQKLRDTTLLKVLGAKFGTIRAMVIWEFGLLGFTAALLGAGGSVATGFVISKYLFAGAWVFAPAIPLASLFLVTAICVFTGLVATWRALKVPAVRILHAAA